MSTAGVAGSILGLMAWKSEVQDEIVRDQKDLRALTQEGSIWTRDQAKFHQNEQTEITEDFVESTYNWLAVAYTGFGYTEADVWGMTQEAIDFIEGESQEIEARIAQEQSDLATIQAEIEAEHAENKDNNKMYYGNPFAG